MTKHKFYVLKHLKLPHIHRDGDEAADVAIDVHSAPGVREKAIALHGEILCGVR